MLIESVALAAAAGIRHGFFTREGGVSEGLYGTLNCGLGSGDRIEHVRENRARAMARLGAEHSALCTLYQVHSADVVTLDRPFAEGDRPKADGLVTRAKGVALGVLAADCAPVLLADPEAGVIGAAHAGWKGALGGVLEATLGRMIAEGARAERTIAAIGPCIRQASYEVGGEFRARFVADETANDRFFRPSRNPGHWRFDLAGYAARRLARAGIARIDVMAHDTCADRVHFFSYRRACLMGEADYGRLLSAIILD
jgi:hypothetical protein